MGKMGFRDTNTDPYSYLEITSGTSSAIGLDNSDSDKLKVVVSSSVGATPSTANPQVTIDPAAAGDITLAPTNTGSFIMTNQSTNTFVMNSAGVRTLPLQSSFLAQPQTESNITGDGTLAFLGATVAMTVTFNRNSNFNPGDGAGTPAFYTAPVTGIYFFGFLMSFQTSVGGGDYFNALIRTTSQDYYLQSFPTNERYTGFFGDNGFISHNLSILTPLTAGDTVMVGFASFGGNKTDGYGGGFGTYFCGGLVC